MRAEGFDYRGTHTDECAQVHVLEMLTLFWLFFMSATFIIQIQVPDPVSPSSDASLQFAAEDALVQVIAPAAVDSANHTGRMGEMLAAGDLDVACNELLSSLPSSVHGNCWVARDGGPLARYGGGSTPLGRTLSVHELVHDQGVVWTVSVQVWHSGGGA